MSENAANPVTSDKLKGSEPSIQDQFQLSRGTLPSRSQSTDSKLVTEISLDDAREIWDLALKRNLSSVTPCGPVPDAISESAILLRVTADGEIEARLPLLPRFSRDTISGKNDDKTFGALTGKGIELFEQKLTEVFGAWISVENGFVYRSSTESAEFEKIGWLPGVEDSPERTKNLRPSSREELMSLYSGSPVDSTLEKGRDLVFYPATTEATSPETLRAILNDGLTYFQCYVEAVCEQTGHGTAPREKLAFRVPKEKKLVIKTKQEAHPSHANMTQSHPSVLDVRRKFNADSRARVQVTATRMSKLWEQAQTGKFTSSNGLGVSIGLPAYTFSEEKVKLEFTALGELRLHIPLGKGNWGEKLMNEGRSNLSSLLRTLNEYRRESGLLGEYKLEHDLVYLIYDKGDPNERFEGIAVLPRDQEQVDNEKLSELIKGVRTGEIELEEAQEKLAECTKIVCNKNLIVKSGSERITTEHQFQESLEQALLIAQGYLISKGIELFEIPPREQLVVKPLPQELDDRRRATYTLSSFFFDVGEDRRSNELLRAIEAQEQPEVDFRHIKAQPELVRSLELFVEQIKNPQLFADYGAEAPDAILIYGPPGNGKSTAAAAIANILKSGFINISFKELLKSGGNIEKHLKDILKIAEEWADSHPSGRTVLFLDEIDVHLKENERFDVMLRTHLSGLEKSGKIVIVAATNYPNIMSPGLRERFSLQIEALNPSREGIREVVQYHFERQAVDGQNRLASEFDFDDILDELEGYSCRRLKDIVNHALTMLAAANKEQKVREYVTAEDMLAATRSIKKDVE